MQSDTQTKHVTSRQGVQLAEFARKFGVSREDLATFLKDKTRREKFFSDLNTDNWFIQLQAEAKKIGAQLYLIPMIKVNYARPHKEAAMAGGPQTGNFYNVLKVADKYQPSEDKLTAETIVLLNYPKGGGNYDKTVKWGLSNGLRKTTPHVPFAIGEELPTLNYDLGPNPMYVVETTGCTIDGNAAACNVCWDDAERESVLDLQSFLGDNCWSAFRK